MKKIFIAAISALVLFSAKAGAVTVETPSSVALVESFEGGKLETAKMSFGEVPIITVSGAHYEMGRQYGYLLSKQIVESGNVMLLSVVLPSGVEKNLIKAIATQVWDKMKPRVPKEYLEEMRGIIDGAALRGVKLKEMDLAMPIMIANISDMNDKESLLRSSSLGRALDRLAFTCSAFAAWGERTPEGKLLSTRNLDWEARTGIDKFKLLSVYKPVGEDGKPKSAYVVAGWIGFIGAIDGMNEYGVTLSEIGSENKKEKIDGMPWTLMFRQTLENSTSLEEALKVIKDAENTIGYVFVVGDGDAENYGKENWKPSAAAVEENSEHTAVIYEDHEIDRNAVWINIKGEPVLKDGAKVNYGLPLKNAVMRADVAMSPEIRRTQCADNGPGDPDNDGNPLTGGSYNKRHLSQYNALLAVEKGGAYKNPYTGEQVFAETGQKRLIDPTIGLEIAKSAAVPDSSVLTILYAATDLDMYVSWESLNGDKWIPSFDMPYIKINLRELLAK